MPQATISEYWLHPQGIYHGQLVKISDEEGKWGPQIKWTWETPEKQVDEDGNPITDEDGRQLNGRVVDFTGCKVSAKSGLGKLLVAMGYSLPTTKEEAAAMNDEWFQKLLGKRVMLGIVHTLLEDGRTFANVERYAPIGKAGAAAAAAHEPRGPEGDDCPDPSYDHSLKAGKPGFDPFHSCSRMKK